MCTTSCRKTRPCIECKAATVPPISINSFSDWEVSPGCITLRLAGQKFIIDPSIAYDLGSELTSASDEY